MCLTEMSRVSDMLRMPSGVASHVSAGEQLADGGWAGPRQEVDLPYLQQMAELEAPFSAQRKQQEIIKVGSKVKKKQKKKQGVLPTVC